MSSRHISFLETGRAKPSRSEVLTLARAMDMPRGAVNEALLAAGFSPEYRSYDPSDIDLTPLNTAMLTILENYAPMPAIILDGDWNILSGNIPAARMIEILPFQGSACVVDCLLNDDADKPVFANWTEVAGWTLIRLQAEAGKAGPQSALHDLCARLSRDPRLAGRDSASFANQGPILTLNVNAGDAVLSLFTMLAEFTTAQDITMSERRVEIFFAADARTKAFFDRG